MVSFTSVVIIGIAIYSIILVGIGLYSRGKATDIKGFTIADGNIGGFLAGFSIFASWMSASTFMGVPAFFYEWGWPSFAQTVGVVAGVPIALLFIAKPMKRLGDQLDAYTLPELIEERFQSKVILGIVSFVTIAMYLAFMIAQLKAAGLIFKIGIGVSYANGVLLGIALAALYILFGGMWASIITDNLQAIAMILVVIVALPLLLVEVGGFEGMTAQLANIDPTMVQFTEPTFWTADTVLIQPIYWATYMFALPYTMNRILTLRGTGELKKFILSFWVGNTLGMFWIISGGVARILNPNLVADSASLWLIKNMLPTYIGAFLLIGIFAAMMSSVDSLLQAAGSTIGNDIYRKLAVPLLGEDPQSDRADHRATILSKVGVLLFAVVPAYAAIYRTPELLSLFMYGATGLVAGVLVAPLVIGIYWDRATTYSVIAGMLVGATVYLALITYTDVTLYVNAPISSLANAVTLVVVTKLEYWLSDEPSIPDGLAAQSGDKTLGHK